MGKVVTGLKFNPKGKKGVDVYLDGKRAFKLTNSLAMELNIGQVLTDADIKDVISRNAQEEAYRQAISLVSRRPRSEHEIRDRFRRKGILQETQDIVLVRLQEAGFINDLAFAQAWIENRETFRPRSAWALRFELRKKGVSEETIEAALEGFDDDSAAYRAALKAASRWKGTAWEEFRKRVTAYLSRRGFQYSTISPVVKRVWHETTDQKESEDLK